MAIADAISDADLYTLGEACADVTLITGGSGIALGLPGNFRAQACCRQPTSETVADGRRIVGRAGGQLLERPMRRSRWRESRPAFRIDPLALAAAEAVVEQALAFAGQHISREPVLIYATADPTKSRRCRSELGASTAGALVEQALAAIARGLRERGVRKFVVAGGETSGAVVQALGVNAAHRRADRSGRARDDIARRGAARACTEVRQLRHDRFLRQGAEIANSTEAAS